MDKADPGEPFQGEVGMDDPLGNRVALVLSACSSRIRQAIYEMDTSLNQYSRSILTLAGMFRQHQAQIHDQAVRRGACAGQPA